MRHFLASKWQQPSIRHPRLLGGLGLLAYDWQDRNAESEIQGDDHENHSDCARSYPGPDPASTVGNLSTENREG
jgi:hypothetical protein